MLLAELMCKKQIVHVLGHTVLLPVVLMQWHDGVSIAALFSPHDDSFLCEAKFLFH